MSLSQKIRSLPITAGVYLYKNAEGEVVPVSSALEDDKFAVLILFTFYQ